MKSMLNAIKERSLEFAGSVLVGLGLIGFAFSAMFVFDACTWPWDEGAEGVSVVNSTLYSFAIRGLGTCAGVFALGLILSCPRTVAVVAFPFRFVRRGAVVERDVPDDSEGAATGENGG